MAIMHSLHDLHEINAYRADRVSIFQIQNRCMDIYKIWHRHHVMLLQAIQTRIFIFLRSVIPTLRTHEFVRWMRHYQ